MSLADIPTVDLDFLRSQLGREPRGLLSIASRSESGHPGVIQVAPLVNKKPFPTIYWLTDPELVRALSRLEAAGVVKELEQYLAQNSASLAIHLEDQARYHNIRDRFLDDHCDAEAARQLRSVFRNLGVGGIQKWNRVRCLHMFYAFHLMHANFVGTWLDKNYLAKEL